MPTVAVVGATGFLGRHVVRALEEAGHAVIAVPRGLAGIRDAARVVVNCAGLTRGTDAELEADNVQLVASLLRGLDGADARLVQVGSAAEYGAAEPGVPIAEDHVERPASAYGATKLAATRLVLEAARRGGVAGGVLRVFNPVGAGISADLLPGRAALLIAAALRDGGPVRLGPLGATRDFVDARDVANAVVAAVGARGIAGQVVNIGSGVGTTARELVRLLAEAAGYRGPILEQLAHPARGDEVAWQVADISRAKSVLGWSPRRSLGDAVAQLWSAVELAASTSSNSPPS